MSIAANGPGANALSEAPAVAVKSRNPIRRLYNWTLSWADTPYGTPALAVMSFAESSFFPIPPDVLQIALSVAKPRLSFYYAFVSMLASVAGGVAGWMIGMWLWSAVSGFFFSYVPNFTHENFAKVQELYQQNAFLAIFTAAFTPVPYKVFTICAGVFNISIPVLIAASFLGRGGRFFLVGGTIYFFGPTVKTFLEKYFELATVVLTLLGVAGFMAIKYLH